MMELHEWIVTNPWWTTSDLADSAIREEDIAQRTVFKPRSLEEREDAMKWAWS
jgi:hypothetical protein